MSGEIIVDPAEGHSNSRLHGGAQLASSRSILSHTSTNTRTSQTHQQRTLSLFRKLVGQRKAEYVSDGPQQPEVVNRRASLASTHVWIGFPQSTASVYVSSSRNNNTLTAFLTDTSYRRSVCAKMLYSKLWRILLLVLTIILLFGAQFRTLILPKAADRACDAIFMATFVLFVIDCVIRIDVEPNYFVIRFCNFFWSTQPSVSVSKNSMGNSIEMDDHPQKMPSATGCVVIEIGSFLFWCDVVSTFTLLHEISFIAVRNFAEASVAINLDQNGVPISGLQESNSSIAIQADMGILVIIGRTVRVARFIRSTTAINVSSKFDWFWITRLFNSNWWQCNECTNRKRLINNTSENLISSQTVIDNNNININNNSADFVPKRILRRASLTFSAAGNTMIDAAGIPKKVMKLVRIVPTKDVKWRRQVAASKIQRAWRHSRFRSYYHSMTIANVSLDNLQIDAEHNNTSAGRNVGDLNGSSQAMNSRTERDSQPDVPSSSSSDDKAPLSTNVEDGSQFGAAMRELTGQRVAIGIILALALTAFFTYTQEDATKPATMIVLHGQTAIPAFAGRALQAAKVSSVPDLFYYQTATGEISHWQVEEYGVSSENLRLSEIYRVTVNDTFGNMTLGLFSNKAEKDQEAIVSLLSTIFILILSFFGVTAFAGPVMLLVVIPIERMVRLLGMLMIDPLGYENTPRYKRFMEEEDLITKNTNWTKEVLKGMETSFLMSTILRIGSLMKVGFGSAGVEIIRNNLQKGQNRNNLVLSSEGSRVFCIFLFCDIRQFTDATECLQEEVFVFTNRIAAVVHSICHSYGGSANKNIGDAFLLSWLLDEEPPSRRRNAFGLNVADNFRADSNQADKALLSVVKICMSLYYDDFYLKAMSDGARKALLAKLSNRKGPVVQMGFGIHAGPSVQGAIGSQRKIDATYVSEHVERAEFLESSTKKYGVKMLMSDSFHRLLHSSNRRRCRKVDQVLLQDDDEDDDGYEPGRGVIIDMYTFDMDLDSLWKTKGRSKGKSESGYETDSDIGSDKASKGGNVRLSASRLGRRMSYRLGNLNETASDDISDTFGASPNLNSERFSPAPELILPNGPVPYNANVWIGDDMRRVRQLYSDGLFFQKYNSGLQSFYARDWEHAKQCFATILDRFEDGPSRYFMGQIEASDGVPPRTFKCYGVA